MSSQPIVLTNGRIATMRTLYETVSSIAVQGDRVLAVGSFDEVSSAAGPEARTVDLNGAFVTPGFVDAHAHVELGSKARDFWIDVRGLEKAQTLQRLSDSNRGNGAWLVAQATYRQELPTRAELDDLLPGVPVVVRLSMHRLVASTMALQLSGIDRHGGDPVGSRIERDATGEPTGVIEEGFDLMRIPPVSQDALEDSLQRSLTTQFLANGVTTVYELPASPEGARAYQALARRGALPIRMTLNPIVRPGHQPIADLTDLAGIGLQTGFGDAWLKLGAVKIFVDGDDDAAMHRRLLDDSPRNWGVLTRTYQQLYSDVMTAHRSGLQLWIHAIGDAAQEMTIDALEAGHVAFPELDARPRIEHIANGHWNPHYLSRLQRAGIIPVPTAAFMHGAPGDAQLDAPSPRYLYRTLSEAGLMPPGNSDTAGTQPFATNPLHGIYCMTARKNVRGEAVWSDEAVSIRQAIAIYTHHSAYAGFLDSDRGTLEAGKLADLVIYREDLDTVSPEQLLDIRPQQVFVGGEVAYDA